MLQSLYFILAIDRKGGAKCAGNTLRMSGVGAGERQVGWLDRRRVEAVSACCASILGCESVI